MKSRKLSYGFDYQNKSWEENHQIGSFLKFQKIKSKLISKADFVYVLRHKVTINVLQPLVVSKNIFNILMAIIITFFIKFSAVNKNF